MNDELEAVKADTIKTFFDMLKSAQGKSDAELKIIATAFVEFMIVRAAEVL